MMPSRSTPNLRENKTTSVYSYLQNQSGLNFAPVSTAQPTRNENSPPPAPPVRDSSSLKSIKYGPGHEKFPSWPVPAAADTPQALRSQTSGGGSHRSKSWTDHTNYPKEKVVTYTRPYMKRQHSQYTQQKLKTVMEKCEKIPPETFESRYDKMNERLYLPHVDHDGKSLGDLEYMVPSPPERDITNKPQLTQADLEEYARSYQEPKFCEEGIKPNHSLTESGLEEFMEYTRSYEDSLFNSMNSKHEESMLTHLHQKQISYAQSEGYHSYVSSTDSTSTPFLDRLRRDSDAVVTRPPSSNTWDELNHEEPSLRREGRDSVVTTSSGSASSSETLKWHGSMSDVSVTSHSSSHLANSSSSRQLIAHSSRVQTPQRHHSESVLYMSGESKDGSGVWKDRESRNNNANKLKLFPVNTYTVQENDHHSGGVNNSSSNRLSLSLQSALSVADRISELEKQQKYSYLDPDKKHKIPDPTLKAIQKKALLSFYERHHNTSKSAWRSEPQLAQSQYLSIPQPPPKVKVQMPSRRASSASDYASGNNSKRSSLASSLESKTTDNISKTIPRHQHSNSCGSLATDLLGPVIMGPSISVDDWVPDKPPERPPKNPHLRTAFPDLFQDQRVPSPDLPPPSPPNVIEDEVFNCDEPLPPPPPECNSDWQQEFNDRLKENTTGHQIPAPQVQKSSNKKDSKVIQQTVGIPERNMRHSSVRSSIRTKSGEQIFHQVSSKPYNAFVQAERPSKPEQVLGFPSQRGYQERSSTRYPTTQKLVLNGNIAVSQKVNGACDTYKPEPLRPHNRPMEEVKKHSATLPADTHRAHRASIAESPIKDVPPPLQPRQMRVNQSMRARISHDHRSGATSRSSPMKEGMRETRSASLSQSKASYLAPRRERDRIVPDSETGSYKRTMSPNGHALSAEVINESQRVNSRESIWPLNRSSKDVIKNNNILRRASMNEKQKEKCDDKEDLKPNLALPDVLPVNVKLYGPRSQYNRPTHLSLSPLDNDTSVTKTLPKSPMKSPPSSPSKSPSRGSPFAPLRTINLSSASLISTTINSSAIRNSSVTTTTVTTTSNSLLMFRNSPITSTPNSKTCTNTVTSITNTRTSPAPLSFTPSPRTFSCQETKISTDTPPQSPQKSSPLIKPSISPSCSMKLSPLRISPSTNSSSTGTPLHISPLTIPASSPVTKSPSTPELSPPSSPKRTDEYPKVVEGLQLIQRTEVILRVNTSTTDASSQTEKEELPPTPLPTRKKLQEEIECEKLAEDLIDHLPTSDRLKELLVPGPEHKKPTDYVQGLFRVDVTSRPRPASSPFRSKNNTPCSTPPPSSLPIATTGTTTKLSLSPTIPIVPIIEPTSPLSGSSIYFTTSEPKAKFLTRYSQDMNKCHIVKDTKDLSQKKEELVSRLDRKLEVLRSEQLVVTDECKINDELGENVETHINRVARPHEVAKFRLHVEEVGKITSLLLGLSGRLARAENALMGMAEDHPERRILEAKRDKLLDQLEEAKKLKECIDRRSISVSNILYKYLNSEEYTDYDHFINMKAKLIMDSKEISDKIKLGEEQLLALKETLIVTD